QKSYPQVLPIPLVVKHIETYAGQILPAANIYCPKELALTPTPCRRRRNPDVLAEFAEAHNRYVVWVNWLSVHGSRYGRNRRFFQRFDYVLRRQRTELSGPTSIEC